MAISRTLLESTLKSSVCEIKWVRRIPRTDYALSRRALATNSRLLLNTKRGASVFKYASPTQPNVLDTARLNLVTYYDLMRLEYRNVSCESAVLIKVFPLTDEKTLDKWWATFNRFIKGMSGDQKKQFMDS